MPRIIYTAFAIIILLTAYWAHTQAPWCKWAIAALVVIVAVLCIKAANDLLGGTAPEEENSTYEVPPSSVLYVRADEHSTAVMGKGERMQTTDGKSEECHEFENGLTMYDYKGSHRHNPPSYHVNGWTRQEALAFCEKHGLEVLK